MYEKRRFRIELQRSGMPHKGILVADLLQTGRSYGACATISLVNCYKQNAPMELKTNADAAV